MESIRRQENRRGERGFALITVLALLMTLSLLVASAVTLTQYASVEVASFDRRNRSYYTAESTLNRTMMCLAQDRMQYSDRHLGQLRSTEAERWMSDGRIHRDSVYGEEVEAAVSDAVRGMDVAGNNPSRQFLAIAAVPGEEEAFAVLCDRLADYVDVDDLVRLNGGERAAYQQQQLPELPRNRKMQFREELRWIPGFSERYPADGRGDWACIRVIAPERLRPLTGRPNLYSTPTAILAARCSLSDPEREVVELQLERWRRETVPLLENLPPEVSAKLLLHFATTESGFDLIEVDTATETDPGVRLSATLRVDPAASLIEFYEFATF